ncbi:MAG: hypothetical protein KGL39_27460 [Patescibacteria group bacterium]|nr:hypothetical protein [Patescibacteria group bacterium]
MSCSRCNGIGLVRKTRMVPPRLYGTVREVIVTGPCPACGGTGKARELPPVWWLDKDESDDSPTAA